MIKRIIIGLIALIVIAAGVVTGVYYWKKLQEPKPLEGETEIALVDEEAVESPETPESEVDVVPELPDAEVTTPSPEAPAETEISLEDETVDVSPEDTTPPIPGATEEAPEAREISGPTTESPRPPRPAPSQPPRPATTEREEISEQPSEITVTEADEAGEAGEELTPTPVISTLESPTPTPIPTTPVVTPTPAPPSGNYSVYTLVPVLETQLPAVRKAMKSLGVQLQEQKTGQPQRIQATKVVVGFFRTKQEATSWARTNFRPKGVKYYVYPAQGMYSIQVGVYTQPPNAERAMRELYRKFPGWRLPVRTEMTTLTKALYQLSIRGIPESLARKVQDTLVRLGIQAELAGV
jgi:hypothetical protein